MTLAILCALVALNLVWALAWNVRARNYRRRIVRAVLEVIL